MFCNFCGNEIPDGGLFCPECGTKLEPQQVEVPVYEEAPAFKKAPAFTAPIQAKPIQAKPIQIDPIYAESIYKKSPAFNEPVQQNAPVYDEPVYAEPVYQETPAYAEPVYQETPAYVEPVYQEAPAYAEPVYQEAPAYAEPVYQETPAYAEPVYPETPAYAEPVYQEAPAYAEPVYQAEPAYAEPVYQAESAYAEPVYQEAPAYEEPVYQKAPAHKETPVYKAAPAYTEPSYAEVPVYDEPYDPNSKRCERCGASIPLDSRFCPECRARQSDASPMPNFRRDANGVMLAQAKSSLDNMITPEMKAKLEKNKKLLTMIAGGAAAVLLILLLVLSMIKPRIDLNKYVTMYAEGFEGYGYVQVEFDQASFCADFGKELAKSAFTDEERKQFKGDREAEGLVRACEIFLEECVDNHLANGDMLSDGDVATLQWTCKDATALNKYGCKLVYKDIEYTVKSLQEARVFDPFEGIEVVFEGIAPYGRAYLEGEPVAPAAREMRYDLDVREDLSNGDTVTITLSSYQDDMVQYCIENFGMVPESLTKEVTVSGLQSYVAENNQISASALQSMQQQAEDVFNARMAQEKQQGESLAKFEYVGNYLLANKDREMFGGNYNRLYLVYKVQMRNKYANGDQTFDKTTDMYWFINFNDIMVDDQGETSVNMSSYDLPRQRIEIDSGVSSGRYSTYTWEYNGYKNLDDMYNDVVAVNVETYTCESTVNAD